ncbi:ATP-binding cassette domain-containing protein [Vreelandella malpeensis]|uniref:ATP-binding cassette domain-containing protein n=1 Tax=Vreelandella malpeensis TaxID=1172368 RepID=A0ABS8DWH8_9GAMM|nr:ATP-binding cassette domain-containing protein [Halomonas malpeensis]
MSHQTLNLVDIAVDAGAIRLVDGVSLTLARGEVVALVGASGSGKSLTCAAALDALPAGTRRQGGQVWLDGAPIAPERLRGRVVASVLQNPRSAFNPVRTLGDHAEETLQALGMEKSCWKERIHRALREAGLDEPQRLLGLYPFEMSGGMLQRAMIALALASEAPFLFADEPTTDLDVIHQREILDLLAGLRERFGLGILLITHDMGVVARLADRVLVMDQGCVQESAPVEAIFRQPRHAVTRALVAAHLSLYPAQEITP